MKGAPHSTPSAKGNLKRVNSTRHLKHKFAHFYQHNIFIDFANLLSVYGSLLLSIFPDFFKFTWNRIHVSALFATGFCNVSLIF
jgi:hypothetical protein